MAHLRKSLTWRDGFAIALVIPNGLLLTVGYGIGAIGAWTAIALWIGGALIGLLQNMLFAETAAMFPGKSGGVSRYAAEGWKRYFAPLGAVAAYGYWIGWSFSIAVNAAAIGKLVTAQWLPRTPEVTLPGGHAVGAAELIGVAAVFAAWACNYFGARLTARASKITSGIVFCGLVVVVAAPFLNGHSWHAANLTWYHGGSWLTLLVWFYVTAWTTYGTEICASFAPEYKDTVRDTAKALRATSVLSLVLFFVVPLAMVGSVGEDAIREDPVGAFALAFEQALGGFSSLGVLILVASMFLGMVSTTADGGRALYGLAREKMTVRQLDQLNRWGVPGRALTLDAVLNSAILLLLGEPLSILIASNFGYLVAVVLAVSAFLLLRKDRPDWPRPIRRGRAWTPVAWVVLVIDVVVVAAGVTHPSLAGQGGPKDTLIAIGILLLSVVLYVYRRVVQDKQRIAWRIETPALPEPEPGTEPQPRPPAGRGEDSPAGTRG
ncbi:APC family permease [Streptomyces sp. Ru73]|uniref:APC family permease n=1 Tax=Streptomyces sp. Ru73 TaxID=2080748 RepID=UPI000CDE25E1|nr:APC family permease [Streptomyces sp. Ru73]POX42570.1 APC family permease [Streptomyces sp. Ru73]